MLATTATWGTRDLPRLLEMLFARSQVGFSFHDRDLRFVYVNEVLARVGGLPPSAYVGRTFAELLPEIGAAVVPYVRQVFATGEPLLARAFRLDERAWVVSYYPVRAPDGEVVGVGTVAFEDTERRRAERLLRRSEERYRALVDMSPDAIVTIEEGRITFANAAAARLIAAPTPAAMVGRAPWDLVHPDDLERAQREFAEALLQGTYRPYEGRFVRRDGTEFIGTIAAAAYERGGNTAVQAVIRDVTAERGAAREREELITQLEMERGLLRTVLAQLPAGVVVLDPQGMLLLANAEASRIWGAPLEEQAVPLTAWPQRLRTTRGATIATTDLRLVQALRGAEAVHDLGIDGLLCADGTERSLRGSVAPITAGDGTTLGAVTTFWDVSEQVRAQEELRRARDELEVRVAERTASLAEAYERLRHEVGEREHAERQLRVAERLASIGTFAAGIAHEINNPLAAIVATAEVVRALVGDGAPRAEMDAALGRIVAQAHHCGEIVRGILSFARAEDPERWPIDPREVVRRTCEAFGHEVAPGVTLHTRFGRRLPSVVMNPTELEQIVVNLVHNAVQAGATRIVLELRAREGHLDLRIRDNGRGIARAHLERIFDPFFTTRQDNDGTGLGLSVVHGIVTRRGGTIAVQSRQRRGTSFTIALPLGDGAAAKVDDLPRWRSSG